jgi:hypothetical protein
MVSFGEFVEQAGEFVLESHDSPVRILASARAWHDLTGPGRARGQVVAIAFRTCRREVRHAG